MNGFKKALALLGAALLAFAMAGCASKAPENAADTKSDMLSKIKEKGVLVVGTSADYAPFEFHKEIDGKDQIVGFEMAMARQIAKDLGVNIEIKDMEFKGLVAAMNTGKVDVLISGMNPTPERAQNADFSIPYYEPHNSVLVKAGNEANYTKTSDFNGKKVGVQTGSTQEAMAKDSFKESTFISLAKIPNLIMNLKTGKVDGIVLNTTVGENYSANDPTIKMTSIDLGSEGEVVVLMPKGETALKAEIDKSLQNMIDSKMIKAFVVEANNLNN